MDEKTPLTSGEKQDTKNYNTRLKVFIYILLYGCALEIRQLSETQFVYAYLKNHTAMNTTFVQNELNVSNEKDQNCEANSTGSNDDYIQGLASDWTWYIQIVTYIITILVLIILGPLSDQIGRKPVMIFHLLVTAVSYAARTYVVYANMSLYWYLLFSAVDGIAGAHYLFSLLCSAILSNCTTPNKDRQFMLAIYDAMMGIGMSCSEISAGYLINSLGYTFPYLIATCMLLVVCMLMLITLREKKKDTKLKLAPTVKGMFTIYTEKETIVYDSKKYLLIYLSIYVCNMFPLAANSTLKILYALGSPFCWSSVHIGWYSAGANFGELVIGTSILKLLLFCAKGEAIAVFGCVSGIVSYVLFGFATSDWMIYEATAVGIIRILPIPMLKAIMSRMVHPDKQGALFANIYLLGAVCRLAGSTVFNNIYHQTRPIFKGMVFFVMAGFPLCAGLIMMCITCTKFPVEQMKIVVDEPTIQTNDSDTSHIRKQADA